MPHLLPTHIRRFRKRSNFSQREVAFLLGFKGGTQISRYEHFARVPTLETALACQALFNAPMHELFPGMFENAERNIINRSQQLIKRLEKQGTKLHKLECLRSIASRLKAVC